MHAILQGCLLTLEVRQTHLPPQLSLPSLPLRLFRTNLTAELLVLLDLAVLGDWIVHNEFYIELRMVREGDWWREVDVARAWVRRVVVGMVFV